MWKGWIIEQSLADKSILSRTKITKIFEEEDTSGDERQVWKLHTVEIENKEIGNVIRILKKTIKLTWYAHFTDGKYLIIVFANKSFKVGLEKVGKEKKNGIVYFKIKPKEKETWQSAYRYGIEKAKVEPRYMIEVE